MKTIFSDEAFVKSLFAMETVAEVQAALKEKGVEMTEAEILSVRELLVKAENGEISAEQLAQLQATTESGELPDEVLENIAGGSVLALSVYLTAFVIGMAGGSGGYLAATRRW